MGKIVSLFRFEQISGVLILAAIALGIAAANSSFAALYWALHHAPIHIGVGRVELNEPLIEWINQGLMVFFFLLVGLEIKREVLEGHLSVSRQAALPAIAAIGGMVVPALVYAAFNWSDPATSGGWAVPAATDIVLALGILSLLGSRVPLGLKMFLTALAIFDDIGAVLIVGLFYGDGVAMYPLLFALAVLIGLSFLNLYNVAKPVAFISLGILLWLAMIESGVEAALAGVLIAFAIPLRVRRGARVFSPLRRTERNLHPWVALLIVPLFAFLNSGVRIDNSVIGALVEPVSLGIISGLVIGKQVGVFGASYAAVRFGLGQLPDDVTWPQIYGASIIAGIGFTMSLFVASLAFSDPLIVRSATTAVLVASLLAAIAGLIVIYVATGDRNAAKIWNRS